MPVASMAVVAVVAAGCSSIRRRRPPPPRRRRRPRRRPHRGVGRLGRAPASPPPRSVSAPSRPRPAPLAGYFNGIGPGMEAYFDLVNSQGGINGRKIVLTADLDDGGSPSQFTQQVHTAIDQDHVFAVGVASAWFTPAYFVSTGTPTYGYNVSANWQTAPNLFAAGGSTQIYSAGRSRPWVTSSRRRIEGRRLHQLRPGHRLLLRRLQRLRHGSEERRLQHQLRRRRCPAGW